MNISKIYKKIKGYRDRDRSKLYITPLREWSIILFINTVLILFVICFSYYAFNVVYIDSFKEDATLQTNMDPYDIEAFKIELSETIQYYEKKTQEHNDLLKEQLLFEDQMRVTGSTTSSSDIHEIYNIGGDDVIPSTDEILPKIFNQVESKFFDTASVWKAFFVDPFK